MSQSTQTPSEINFDLELDRRNSDSIKWNFYDEDVMPMWVADMDFRIPDTVMDALHTRIDHGTFGYPKEPARLRELICARMETLYHWRVTPEQILFLPGLVAGLNLIARASDQRGSGVLVNTPVYPPFLTAPTNQDRETHEAPLARNHRHDGEGRSYLHYEIDFNALKAATQPHTRLFMFCNPHNPIGRAYTRPELEQLAEFCLRHDLDICSDEIHCDLLLGATEHIPIASVNLQLAERSITLLAPSKTFNMPGLGCSLAIIPNREVRQRVQHAAHGIMPHVNALGYVAAIAAYEEGGEWLEKLKGYLTDNRQWLFDFFKRELPAAELTWPEATYLAWIDFRPYGIDDPYQYFLEHARVALASGASFGTHGTGFARLNFGTPRATLQQGLEKIAAAVQRKGAV
jgi:cystathionine beta-lyase